jgi:transcriptional regulator with XRE-family HTH domain
VRDITGIFRLLQTLGISQRTIAALADMSQSEVSEVIKGYRRVQGYNTMVRICEGLGIPRDLMGLAYSGDETAPADYTDSKDDPDE